jgi:DNA-binding NarL/FixJ family response regulator
MTLREPVVHDSDDRRFCVLVADGHEISTWGLRLLLTRQPWVARCVPVSSADDIVAHALRYDAQTALIDLSLSDGSGATACRAIVRDVAGIRVLLMSSAGTMSRRAASALGAHGFVSKAAPAADVITAVHRIATGGVWFPGRHAMRPRVGLSPREREVLHEISTGATNPEIASRLAVSPNTVKQHTSAIYRKLQARNRTEAVQLAVHAGLLGADDDRQAQTLHPSTHR